MAVDGIQSSDIVSKSSCIMSRRTTHNDGSDKLKDVHVLGFLLACRLLVVVLQVKGESFVQCNSVCVYIYIYIYIHIYIYSLCVW